MIEIKSCILLAVLAYTATAAKHVIFEKIEVIEYNKELAENVVVTLFQKDDGKQAVNFTSVLKLDLGNDIKGTFEISRLMDDNSYKLVSMLKDSDVCALLEKDFFGVKQLLKYGNVTLCPWKANSYYLANAMVDFSKIPPNAPNGKYKLSMKFHTGDTYLGQGLVEGELVDV